LEAGKHVLIIF